MKFLQYFVAPLTSAILVVVGIALVANISKPLSAYVPESNYPTLLATTSNIDGKVVASTTIFTATGTCYPTSVLVEVTSGNTVTVDPVFNIGNNASGGTLWNNYASAITMSLPHTPPLGATLSTGRFMVVNFLQTSTISKMVTGDVMKISITTGATATTTILQTKVFGFCL